MSSEGDELPSSEPDATPGSFASSNTTVATNTTTATTASNTTANIAASKPPVSSTAAANSNTAAVALDDLASTVDRDAKTPAAAPPPSPAQPKDDAKAEEKRKTDFVEDGPPARRDKEAGETDVVTNRRQNNAQDPSVARNEAQISPDSRNVQRSQTYNREAPKKSVGGIVAAPSTQGARAGSDAKAKTEAAQRTRTLAGKTFTFADGVWYDSAYKRGATVNVRRGTDEYNKLDADLRAIAQKIGGTVVVVWKGKAYRIQ
jgi:hypothetical protein